MAGGPVHPARTAGGNQRAGRDVGRYASVDRPSGISHRCLARARCGLAPRDRARTDPCRTRDDLHRAVCRALPPGTGLRRARTRSGHRHPGVRRLAQRPDRRAHRPAAARLRGSDRTHDAGVHPAPLACAVGPVRPLPRCDARPPDPGVIRSRRGPGEDDRGSEPSAPARHDEDTASGLHELCSARAPGLTFRGTGRRDRRHPPGQWLDAALHRDAGHTPGAGSLLADPPGGSGVPLGR